MQLQITPPLKKRSFCVESYTSSDIPLNLIPKIADFYRYIFNNNGNYLVFPTTLEFLSPAAVFGKNEGEIVDLATMDALRELPTHPQTGERAIFWHDPVTTLEKIRTKLEQNGYVTILRNQETGNLEGLCFGTVGTISEHFKAEGWHNPLYYANREVLSHNRNLDKLVQRLQVKLGQHPDKFDRDTILGDDLVYCWNCLTTSPKLRGIDNLLTLTSQYFASIPQRLHELPVISEVRFRSTSHNLLNIAGYLDVPGTLTESLNLQENSDSLIIVAPLAAIAQNFSLSPREFRQLTRQRRKERQINDTIKFA